MTNRERVISAFQHKSTDYTPYFMEFTILENEKLKKSLGDDFYKDINVCFNRYSYWGWPQIFSQNETLFKDTFGVIWDRSGSDKDIGVINSYVIEDIENNLYTFPPIDEARLRAEIELSLSSRLDKFTIMEIGFSMFERAWSLCGMENILIAMLTAPDELTKLLNDICDYNSKAMDILMDYDIDGFYFGDDWGSQRGLIMGKSLWQQFIKPQMARLYKKAKDRGLFVIQHSCGDISEIFEDLIEIGLDCYQTVQPEIYDFAEIKAKYGDRLSFWGGISTQTLLPNATPQLIRDTVAKTIKFMGTNGGYIVAPSHAVEHDVPALNILALIDAVKNQG